MHLVMMGTGPFAAPTYKLLLQSSHTIDLLVTRPPRPVHGKSQAEVNPLRELAQAHGKAVFEPESINTEAAHVELFKYHPDLFVVCDYGQILSPETLGAARFGGINLHASLLPKYRGAAPINWALLNGDTETGVTVLHMDAKVDAGPAVAQQRTMIHHGENVIDLELRLAELGAPLVLSSIAAIETGTAQPIPQDAVQATRAPRLKKADGEVDWHKTAIAICNQVRALYAWPKTFSHWQRDEDEPLRLILDQVEALPAKPGVEPGTVVMATGDELRLATGDGHLRIVRLQPAGKRVVTAGEFLRGYPVKPGDRLGS